MLGALGGLTARGLPTGTHHVGQSHQLPRDPPPGPRAAGGEMLGAATVLATADTEPQAGGQERQR